MIQSTRWTSSGPRIVEGYRVFYTDNSSGRQQKGALITLRESTLLKGGAISSFDLVPGRALAVRVAGRQMDWTFLTAYAPVDVLATTLVEREAFWKCLNRFSDSLPGRTTLIVGGDFNAHVGVTHDGVAGPCGQEAFTPNGEALCDWARSQASFLPSTHLKGRPSGWTWQRSDGSARRRLDYWMIPASWRAFVFARGTGVVNCNPMQGATKAIDHRLICLTLQGYPRLWERFPPRPPRSLRSFQNSLSEEYREMGDSGPLLTEMRRLVATELESRPQPVPWSDLEQILLQATHSLEAEQESNHSPRKTWIQPATWSSCRPAGHR